MKATNSLTQQKEKKTFSAAITGNTLQGLIKKSVPTPEAAARLTATLISAVASSPKLQECDPAMVVAAALQGEGEGLTYGREYSIIPFGQSATFVRGWRGWLSLLYATGEIADTDCFEVREGEIVGRDRRTKHQLFDFSKYDTDEEARKHPIIGYYFYVDYLNGRFVYDYMSVDEILHHADTYVPYFSLSLFNKWKSGEALTDEEFKRFKISYEALIRLRRTGEGTDAERKAAKDLGAWYDEGLGQVAMMKKTVILKLMRSGRVRLSNSAAIREAVRYDDIASAPLTDINLDNISVVESTGEAVDGDESAPEAAETVEAEIVADDTAREEEAPKTRKRASRMAQKDDAPVNPVADFFGESDTP